MEFTNTLDGAGDSLFKSYLIFGPTKTGKTLLASTLPSDEVLVGNSENNLDSLHGANINTVSCQTVEDLNEILDAIIAGEITPKWFLLDSITDLLTKVFNLLRKKHSDGRKLYPEFEEIYGDIIGKLKILPCNIVLLARQTQVSDEVMGGSINAAALPWKKLQADLPFNFSAVLATCASKGEDGNTYYAIQCQPCPNYQVGVRTKFGKTNPLEFYEPPDLMAIHNKLVNC